VVFDPGLAGTTFVTPATRFEWLPRNISARRAYWNLDLSVVKRFEHHGGVKLQFRMEGVQRVESS